MKPNPGRSTSESDDPVRAPRHRDLALGVAHLRQLGYSQSEAAKATGVTTRTVGRWEECSWWPDVQREAAERWLEGLTAKARRGLEGAVLEDGRLALQVLERIEPALAPPHRRAAARYDIDFNLLSDDELDRVAAGEDLVRILMRRPCRDEDEG